MMLVILGNTEIALIPGISVAGATPELTRLTPPADVEYVFYGKPKVIDAIPVTPEGHPTPAIITKASWELGNFPLIPVRGGSYLAPNVPHVFITDEVGKDFRKEKAVPNAKQIIEKAKLFGQELSKSGLKEIVIGESIPGGTTTAQAVLWALGYDAKTSSASPENPQPLKEQVINEAFKRVGIQKGDFAKKPLKALEELGDPMMATVIGIAQGFRGEIVLAGGTQMLAIASLLKALGEDMERFMIATTKWIVNDKSSTFKKTANEIGVMYCYTTLSFENSKFKGLRDYEKGYVKEGVGAGGSVYLAKKKGFSEEEIANKIEELYERLMQEKS